jgi:polyisoprenoid-binding protein YceI
MNATEIRERTASGTIWAVEQDDSFVEFAVKTFWGLATVKGRFDRFVGWYETRADGAQLELTIDADSLDTGNRTRDKHLRSDDFFHVEEHRLLRFASTRVHPVGDLHLHVVGMLEAAGASVELEFPATIHAVDGGLEIEATTTVDQARLGMSTGHLGMIRRPATLHVKARLSRLADPD